jgi:hypothetical protein
LALSAFIHALSVALISPITLGPHHERLAGISAQMGIPRLARNSFTDSLNKFALSLQPHTSLRPAYLPNIRFRHALMGIEELSMTNNEQARAKIVADYYAEFPKGSAGSVKIGTESGTQRTRLNAYKHGLTGQIHLFTPEERDAFEKHCQPIVEALAPVGILEQGLAQAIAENKWRLNRAVAIETGIFALGQLADEAEPSLQTDPHEIDQPEMDHALSQARTWLDDGKHIQLLSLYQQRIQRSIERNMAELRTLRVERKVARDQALAEALLLAQLAQSKGEKYDAAADLPPELLGTDSVFSSAAITRLIDRNQRLNEARDYAKTSVNPKSARQMPAAA